MDVHAVSASLHLADAEVNKEEILENACRAVNVAVVCNTDYI